MKNGLVTKALLLFLFIGISSITLAQVDQDFENYKKQEANNFEKFKQKRNEELKRMQREYQDYYNSLMGLKTYYEEKKDTQKVEVIEEIIEYEQSVSQATGKPIKVTQNIVVNEETQIPAIPAYQSPVKKEPEAKTSPQTTPPTSPNSKTSVAGNQYGVFSSESNSYIFLLGKMKYYTAYNRHIKRRFS